MKRHLLIICFALSLAPVFAQIPEDALKYSWYSPNGTARSQAVGGATGALGGEITANFVNPAGLGMYKTSEFVITPGYSFMNNNSNFRGDLKTDSKNLFNLGASGFVFGAANPNSRWNGMAFSVAVTRTANFANTISYSGKNNFSSYGEQYAAEAAASGIDINDIVNSNQVSLGTRLAAYTYLIDTATVLGQTSPDVVSMALWGNLKKGAPYLVSQQKTIQTTGGITEIAIGFAATRLDKLYLGGSLGIPIVNYTQNTSFTETDLSGNTNNNFDHSTLTETTTTKGVGLNLKLGAIYKPTDNLRLGLAVHTPTLYGLKDTYFASMTTNTENYVHQNNSTITINSNQITQQPTPVYKYDYTTPWRAILSGAWVLNEVSDVKQQKGFLTADIEYVGYRGGRFRTGEQGGDNSYYDGVNQGVKDYYKGAFNFRVGGEVKFTTIMARAGFGYYMDPYKDAELKGNRMQLSGGLGYRNKGMFIDVTYVYNIVNDINMPYRLSDKANTFALVKTKGANIMLTTGIKF